MAKELDITKSQLGKLLAEENIRVEHRQVSGPFFDVKSRELVLPLWKDMSPDLYDLFIGHEVGHALYTPPKGWEEKAKKGGRSMQMHLNIIEDVRIEKKMKRKFPGLRKPMYNGYTELLNRGFFGVTEEEAHFLPFADRLNLFFKLGSRCGLTFEGKEKAFIDRVEKVETFAEVEALAAELAEMSAVERSEFQDMFDDMFDKDDPKLDEALKDFFDKQNQQGQSGQQGQQGQGQGESDGDEDGEQGEDKGTPGQDGQGESSDMPTDSEGKETKGQPQQGQGTPGTQKQTMPQQKKGTPSQGMKERLKDWMQSEKDEQRSLTEEAMQKRADDLIDTSAYPFVYLNIPKFDDAPYIIPSKKVHQQMKFTPDHERKRMAQYSEFMDTNKRFIAYMVKEFELRRNAKQTQKARVSKTGDLDMEKVWRYKLSEDLFLQSTTVPNGKNHGMLMIIDMSGSMSENMAGTFEQVVCMAMFCRKVRIPFEVYGFTDHGAGQSKVARPLPANNSLFFQSDSYHLLQFLHSGMKASEFNTAIQNLIMAAFAYNRQSRQYYYSYNHDNGYYTIPNIMCLGGTPLNEAILTLFPIAERFKKQTKVEVLNTIILTDGDASYSLGMVDKRHFQGIPHDHRMVLVDPASKAQVLVKGRQSYYGSNQLTLAMLEMYKKITGSRVIGYYLMSGSHSGHKSQVKRMWENHKGRSAYDATDDATLAFEKQFDAEFKKYKFFALKESKGYDVYYMLPGAELEIEDVTMDSVMKGAVTGKASDKGTLLRAFRKMQNSKQVSRVFLNQFILQIA